MEQQTISRLARRVDVNTETIRYYEREGLLEPPERLPSGYRIFPENAVQRVHFIKRAQKLGFSLHEIKELLSLRQELTGRECARVKRLAAEKIKEIDRKIEALAGMRSVLKDLEEQCPGSGPLSGCPIVESLQYDKSDHRRTQNGNARGV
ncbi:MAG TPA: MerR family DNA-binding protein [Acidobacteriaceae bacterium]